MSETKPKNPYDRGGGRKPLRIEEKRKQQAIYVTDDEFEKVKEFISQLRGK